MSQGLGERTQECGDIYCAHGLSCQAIQTIRTDRRRERLSVLTLFVAGMSSSLTTTCYRVCFCICFWFCFRLPSLPECWPFFNKSYQCCSQYILLLISFVRSFCARFMCFPLCLYWYSLINWQMYCPLVCLLSIGIVASILIHRAPSSFLFSLFRSFFHNLLFYLLLFLS